MTNILSFYKVQCADDIKGLPDTNIEFNDNGVDHNPTKKKTNKFLKVGKMAWQALKSLREPLTGLAKDLVNESKQLQRKGSNSSNSKRFTNIALNTHF